MKQAHCRGQGAHGQTRRPEFGESVISSQAGKVEAQMEGEDLEIVVEALPPALYGLAACSAAVGGEGVAD